ncbi:molybdopterin-dependent oxidoreductase [Cognatishimia sp.]|uniref:molybdopterin-dependent oxidoreductase n=1 Tax=Cognatishimia sp. TaxID=2211648 RepID=UPI003516D3C2
MSIKTTCAYCGVGCGVLADVGPKGITVSGDPDHPANFGRLCSKGSALGETLGTEGRLLSPKIGTQTADWDEALDLVADRFSRTIAEHGPDSVAFYVSGQLLTEDYYVINKLAKGFVGTANIDTNSRLCMASTVVGHKRAFGTDTVPGLYEDLEEADTVVLVGSNLAWCHPVLYQRLAAAKAARPEMRVINVDPRRTATCDLADLHLQISPGGDVALFNHLLQQISQRSALDQAFLAASVTGLEAALASAADNDATATGLTDAELAEFVDLWLAQDKTVTVFSQGVNQSTSGVDKVNAIINCHLATGRIGKPGMGPLSVTGQPNAMGGREVGGLANTLACHLDIENPDHSSAVQSFWNAPVMPAAQGLKAVDMFDAIAQGQIKALWVICTNPAQSLPQADAVRDAIKGCDFVVVSDMYDTTDTARLADVVLPTSGWGEKFGTVTNSDRMISRQRALRAAPGEARHDWEIICGVARRMGFGEVFAYHGPADIFREHAALSEVAAQFGKDFDISGLATISDDAYQDFTPRHWPVSAGKTGGRFFGDGTFFTEDGRARMVPVAYSPPAQGTDASFPYRLNTGRIRDQWHTMTRTGLSGRLTQHMAEPYLEVHPEDALKLGLAAATLAQLETPHGKAILRVMISDKVKPGSVFAPLHWTEDTCPSGRINALVAPKVDRLSGQPESKATPVAITPFKAAWYGFATSIEKPEASCDYWARARTRNGWQLELAHTELPEDWQAFAEDVFGISDAEVMTVQGAKPGSARIAFVKDGHVLAALLAAPSPVEVSRQFANDAVGTDAPILAGRPGTDQPDPGPVICACFNVGANTILRAIETQSLASVDAIGAALQAGTNCGSCRPEISAILTGAQLKTAAE